MCEAARRETSKQPRSSAAAPSIAARGRQGAVELCWPLEHLGQTVPVGAGVRSHKSEGPGEPAGSASPAAIPYTSVETTRAPSVMGRRKVPVHLSPCHSEMTRIPKSEWVDIAIRRTGLRASENQTRLANSTPSSSTR